MTHTIYDRVHQKLLELEVDEISIKEFGIIVSNIRINKEEIMGHMRHKLLELGLTVDAVDRICSNLSFKIRCTKADVHDIRHHLRQRGVIVSKGFGKLVINKDAVVNQELVKVKP